MAKRKGDKGEKPKNNHKTSGPKGTVVPTLQVRNNNDERVNSSHTNPNNKRIYNNMKRSFRVVVLFKKDVKYTNENILKLLKISSTGVSLISQLEDKIGGAIIFFKYKYTAEMALNYKGEDFYIIPQLKFSKMKYKVNLPITRANLIKYIDYFQTKENVISSLNIVTNSGFWAIGLNNAQAMETDDNEIYKYLEPIDQNLTVIKLRVSNFISDELLIKEIKNNWDLDMKVSSRKNVTVFVTVNRNLLNKKITKGFYVGQEWIVNYSWHSRQRYIKAQQKKQNIEKLSFVSSAVTTMENNIMDIQNEIKTLNNKAILHGSNYTVDLENAVKNIKEQIATLQLEIRKWNENFSTAVNETVKNFLISDAGEQLFSYLLNKVGTCKGQ
ncbi:hypothetical protein ABK040_011804 [Willaertia magna]